MRAQPVAAAIAAAVSVLAAAAAVQAEAPVVGGSVESTLALSLGEPSPFTRARAGHGRSVYDATVAVEVTATDAPVRLSLADGEASGGGRRGRLVGAGKILSSPLEAAVGHGPYRSLDSGVDPQLTEWSEPLANQTATVRLRQAYRGGASGLRRYHKLLLVTVTAGGP